jgi:hypothetical protein
VQPAILDCDLQVPLGRKSCSIRSVSSLAFFLTAIAKIWRMQPSEVLVL